MELLEGESLRGRIGKGILTWERVLEIAIPIAEGLSVAHSKGIIHRDLKPENVFITLEDRVKILDFGLARWTEMIPSQELTSALTAAGTLRESGIVMGTVPYMSPEQVRGGHVDARTDIFSFGWMLYEMLTANRLFFRPTTAET